MVFVQTKLKIFYDINLQQELLIENKFKIDSLMDIKNGLEALRKTENETFNQSIMKLTDEKSENEQKLQEINNQNAELEKLHNSTLTNLEALKYENEKLENENLNLKQVNNEIKNQIDQKTSDWEILNEKLESSQVEIGNVRAQMVEKEEFAKVVKSHESSI